MGSIAGNGRKPCTELGHLILTVGFLGLAQKIVLCHYRASSLVSYEIASLGLMPGIDRIQTRRTVFFGTQRLPVRKFVARVHSFGTKIVIIFGMKPGVNIFVIIRTFGNDVCHGAKVHASRQTTPLRVGDVLQLVAAATLDANMVIGSCRRGNDCRHVCVVCKFGVSESEWKK